MMGTKKLSDGLEAGVTAVKKADDSLRIVMIVAAAGLAVGILTLACVVVAVAGVARAGGARA